jgi:hypothetical protein
MSSSRSPQVLLRHLANLLAPGLVFLPSFVAFIQFQGYPLWRPEVLSIAGFLLLAGLPFGLLLSLRPRTFGAAAVALLLLTLASQIFSEEISGLLGLWSSLSQDLVAWAGPVGGIALSVLIGLPIAVIPFAALSWLGPNLGIVLATVFSVTLVSTLLLPAEPPTLGETYRRDAGPAKDLPPVIHLIFDGHIGIEGLPAEVTGGDELRDELRDFYEDFGFTLYGRAYSEYVLTRHSMIALLNGFDSLDGRIPDEEEGFARLFWDNRWFKVLAERGYLINLYHLQGWHYCGRDAGHAARCVAYSNGSITNIEDADVSINAKARAIFATFLRTLVPYRTLILLIKPAEWPPQVLPERPSLFAPDSLALLERLLADIRAAPRGTAYFAHLLIPHFTHMMDRDCQIRPDPLTWTSSGNLNTTTGVLNSQASWESRYTHYLAQVRCLHSALRRFLEGLKEIGVFEEATIVIHGDHGSRVARMAPLTTMPGPLSDQDLADMYSVLFALRTPSIAPGYRQGLVSSQALFRETFLGYPPQNGPAEVYFDYPANALASPTPPPFPRRPMSDLRRAPDPP